MSKYSGMSVEDSIARYSEDCGREQEKSVWVERMVNADMADLREYGFTFSYGTSQRDKGFMELLEDADDDFHKNYIYENFDPCINSAEMKARFYEDFLRAAMNVIEKHLYEKYKGEV